MVILRQHFKVLYKIFQLFGFAPINTTTKNVKSNNFVDNIVNLVPTVLCTFFAVSIAYFLLIHPHFESYGPIHGIINMASLFTLTLIVMTGNCASFIKKSVHRNINYNIIQIEHKMHANIPIDPHFLRAYQLKMFLILFLFFLSQGLVFYEASLASSAGMLSSFFTSLFRFTVPMATLHVVMFCDTITNYFRRLNLRIKNVSAFFDTASKLEFLRSMKMMHNDIWKILVQLNRYFGWNLLFIVINSFIYITYQLYWIFVTLQKDWDKLGVVGRCEIQLCFNNFLYNIIRDEKIFCVKMFLWFYFNFRTRE